MLITKCALLSILIAPFLFSQQQYFFFPSNKSPTINPTGNQIKTQLSFNENLVVDSPKGKNAYLIATCPGGNGKSEVKDSIKFYMKFDNYCFNLELFDGNTWINSSENIIWNENQTFAEITAPSGTYQIFTRSQFDTKDFFVIKENVSILQSDTIEIHYQADAKNSITQRNLDENGNILPVIQEYYLTPLEIYFSNFDAKLLFWGFTFFDINCSDLSEEMIFSVGLSRSDFGSSHKNYVINHSPIIGITNDIVLENNPDDFIEHDLNILCSQTSDSVYIGSADCMRFGGDDLFGFGSSVLFPEKIWSGKLFSTPFNSLYTGFCTNLFVANLDNSFRFYTSPIQTENGVSFPYHIAGLENAPPNTVFIPGGSPIELGISAGYCNTFLFNSYNNIYIQYNYLGLFNENRISDLSMSGYELYNHTDSLIAQGNLGSFPTFNVESNEYYLNTKNQNFIIAGEPAEINTHQSFDLRNIDPNPPYITSLNITNENGVPSRKFEKDEIAKINFTAIDIDGNLNNFLIDSTKIYARVSGTEQWQLLPVAYMLFDIRVGYLFESDLTALTNYDSASVELKILIMDSFNNTSEISFEPAIAVGKYGIIADVNQISENNFSITLNNFPNPFNPSTTIRFEIVEQGNVTLKVFDMLGQEIETLVDDYKFPGIYDVRFSTTSSDLSTGIYFYQLKTGEFIRTKKMIYIK